MTKTIITVAGIGGVGGYFGGLLARHFYPHDRVAIHFVARGPHLSAIRQSGLTVISKGTQWTARPHIATDQPAATGIADLMIISTKSYDLEALLPQLGPCINRDTLILPLLNGVDHTEKIKTFFPDNIVLDACVYIVSRLKQPGVVENSDHIQTLYFGTDHPDRDRLLFFENLFKAAGIEAVLTPDISTITWEKFIFISPTATATAYYDRSIGELMADKESLETIKALIAEVQQIARARHIPLPGHVMEKTLNRLNALPWEATSSMHSDFKHQKAHTELPSLTGYVVREGRKHHIPTPVYDRLYAALSKRSGI